MRNNGTILTDADATIDIGVRGDYSSKNGIIIQGHNHGMVDKKDWYERPMGIIVVAIVGMIIAGGILYWFDWV